MANADADVDFLLEKNTVPSSVVLNHSRIVYTIRSPLANMTLVAKMAWVLSNVIFKWRLNMPSLFYLLRVLLSHFVGASN